LGAPPRPGARHRPLAQGRRRRQGRARDGRLLGIGLAAAHRFAQAGAITVICARDEAKLEAARGEIAAAAGEGARVLAIACDIAEEASCNAMVARLQGELGGVDYLVNNAGRSIRRAIEASYERFHDYERTMQLNYFGCLRVTWGCSPAWWRRRRAMSSTSARSAC
jgi:NAD(P)-dependent dehydrogenase (short-subunit alcohol dehydrogenase family)